MPCVQGICVFIYMYYLLLFCIAVGHTYMPANNIIIILNEQLLCPSHIAMTLCNTSLHIGKGHLNDPDISQQ